MPSSKKDGIFYLQQRNEVLIIREIHWVGPDSISHDGDIWQIPHKCLEGEQNGEEEKESG